MFSRVVVILFLGLTLVACQQATTPPPEPEPVPVDTGPTAAERAAAERARLEAQRLEAQRAAERAAMERMKALLAQTTIYFDFDRADLRNESLAVIRAHAEQLASNPGLKVRLEGHADERGSREYNIGLGERRAQSVRRAMSLQGASPGQLDTVSFGEEKPADPGHNEAAWQANRRVEIVYQ